MDARNALAFYNRGLAYWDRHERDKALADYAGRERRFGKTSEQVAQPAAQARKAA